MKRKGLVIGLGMVLGMGLMAGILQAEWWEVWKKEAQAVEKTQVKAKESSKVAGAESKPAKAEATEQKGTPTIKGVYVPKEILNLTWGEGDYQVGVQRGEEIEFVGPQEIRIDNNGNIRILDTINGKILRYTKEGKFLDSIEVSKGNYHMCISDDGTIYVSNEVYTSTGKFLKKWVLPKEIRILGYYLIMDENGTLLRGSPGGGYYPIKFKESEKALDTCSVGKKMDYFPIRNYRIKSLTSMLIEEESILEVLNKKNELKQVIKTKAPPNTSDFSYCLSVLDIMGDQLNNIYVYLLVFEWNKKAENEKEIKYYKIEKYDRNGLLMTTVNLPSPYEDVTIEGRNVDIDKQGNIYYLQTLETGVKVIKYELQ
jgi:hypothetical protein